jgi:hypothetical protein
MRFQIYPEHGRHAGLPTGLWRWRQVARNGNIVADGAEGYASESNCRRAVNRQNRLFKTPLPIEVVDA